MKKQIRKNLPIIIFFVLMIMIHRYVFLYADDFYYARDIKWGIGFLPYRMSRELNTNGRLWVHLLLMFQLFKDEAIFRVVNPIIISITCFLIARYTFKSIHKNSELEEKKSSRLYFLACLLISLFILALPTEIVSTSIFYAACSLNYLYPTILSIVFGYEIYNRNRQGRDAFILTILAFFVGSSTQQGAMIGLGFLVVNFIYRRIFKKRKDNKKDILIFISWFLGFSLIIYGSYKRSLLEKGMNIEIDYIKSLKSIMDTNIFKKPSFLIVLFVLLSSIMIISTLNKTIRSSKLRKMNIGILCISFLALTIYISSYIYMYTYLGEKKPSHDESFKLVFSISYLIIIIYTSILVYLVKKNLFILNSTLNMIGSQVMMMLVNERFASSYKVMFPAILLLSIYIVFGFLIYYENMKNRFSQRFFILCMVVLSVFCIKNYSINFWGYRKTSKIINYNINQIKAYNKNNNKKELLLRKVGSSSFGYILKNWDDMPYFMKENYKIKEDTLIKYIEE